MSKLYHIVLLMLLLSNQSLFAQAKKDAKQTLHLLFQTSVDSVPFSFDSTYQNHFGEAFKVRSFKYYISHLRFVYADGKTVSVSVAPHLINEADSSSKHINLSAPQGNITSVQFLLGIDSVTNTSGVQTGDLDPTKGMFWIWNTGYIMAKLEGSSPQSKAPAKQYSYDVGGFKPGENVAREISLSLDKAVSHQPSAISQQPITNSQPSTINNQLSTTNQQPSTFTITADISKWFYGKNNIKISSEAMCHSPGTLAVQIADNYAQMFSIKAQ